MYYNEGIHLKPHFHVQISKSFTVTIYIETLYEPSRRKLPPGRMRKRIRKWAWENRDALMENWRLARDGETMKQLERRRLLAQWRRTRPSRGT